MDIVEILAENKTGWYAGDNITNGPTTAEGGRGWYVFEVIAMSDSVGYQVVTATNSYGGEKYIGKRYSGTWSGWRRLATATSPTWYDLPLANAFTASQPCKYFKNQFGEVTVCFKAVHTAGVNAGSIVFANLPVGYRPQSNIHGVCTNARFNGIMYAFWVRPNGEIIAAVNEPIPAGEYAGFAGNITFLAP